jgi:ubiquinone/menaquinone biosynthesis C-methylase UbiE
VTGIDFSAPILAEARESVGALPGVHFGLGDAAGTGLPSGHADVVFERALVHHVPSLPAVIGEAWRLLRPGGTYLVQDRTPEDAALPGSANHPRGWLFEVFPRLLDFEAGRRPGSTYLRDLLVAQGFQDVTTHQLWETRRRYVDREDYLAEIAHRTGRSILHELSDDELAHLMEALRERLPAGALEERDRWTVWRGRRPDS